MTARGGAQRIPRPESARPGEPPPWAALTAEQRRFTLDDVRAACALLPTPTKPPLPEESRPAAVLLPMFEEDGETRIIFTKRPDTMPSHQGEIAFPGGKLDELADRTLRDAALREAREEIGLDPTTVEIAGELDSMVTLAALFLLTPFVGLLPARPEITPHPTEVVSVFDVAISELLDEVTFREERWDLPPGTSVVSGPNRPVHFYELPGETVWGATAKILTTFLVHLTSTR